MILSLRAKFVLSIITVEVLMLSLMVSNNLRIVKESNYKRVASRVSLAADLLAKSILPDLHRGARAALEDRIRDIAKESEIVYIVVENRAGEVLARAPSAPVGKVFTVDEGVSLDDVKDGVYDVTRPLVEEEDALGSVKIGFSLPVLKAEIGADMALARRQGIFFAVIQVLLGSLVAFLLGWYLTRHLRALTSLAEKMASGNLMERVEIRGQDEIGTLGVSFNEMASRLHDLYNNLEGEVVTATGDLRRAKNDLQEQAEVLERRNLELSKIAELRSLMAKELDMDTLIERAFFAILESLNLRTGAVWLYAKEDNRIHLRQSKGLSATLVGKIDHQPVQDGNTGIGGTAAYRREMVIAEDLETFPLSQYVVEEVKREGLKSLIAFPLIAGNELLGSLAVVTTVKRVFDAEDLATLEVLSTDLAMAIRNAMIYQDEKTKVRKLEELDTLKDDFLNSVTHDLSTPITTILGYAHILERKKGGSLTEKQEGYVNSIINACKYLSFLVENVLSFTRIEAGKVFEEKSPLSLKEVLEESYDLLKPGIEDKNIRFSLNGLRHDLCVEGEKEALKRLFSNIISNAVKFTPPGGDVHVEADDGDPISISVVDEGKGISPEAATILFKKFGKYGEEKGMGLGLYISKKIVEAHGGTISIESEPEKGTTVTVRLRKYRLPGRAE